MNISAIWIIRAYRLWLVIAIVALFNLAVPATRAIEEIAEIQKRVDQIAAFQKQRAEVPPDPDNPYDTIVRKTKYTDADFARLTYGDPLSDLHEMLAFAAAVVLIPAAMMLLRKLFSWIWATSDQLPPPAGPDEETANSYRRRYWWGAGVFLIVAVSMAYSPTRAAQVLISAAVQSVGLVLIVWVVKKVRARGE